MLYYKNEVEENFMRTQYSRYAGLARKALSYYLGDQYNPQEFPVEHEVMFRQFIQGYVRLKIFHREPYDWDMIDHFFKYYLHDIGYTHITYSKEILDRGYNGVMRGLLPEHHA